MNILQINKHCKVSLIPKMILTWKLPGYPEYSLSVKKCVDENNNWYILMQNLGAVYLVAHWKGYMGSMTEGKELHEKAYPPRNIYTIETLPTEKEFNNRMITILNRVQFVPIHVSSDEVRLLL